MRLATFIVWSILAAAAGAAFAQDPVQSLQDLVGTKGASGEMALKNRGYAWVRTRKSSSDSYSYWRENENGQCIVVRTADGRYASIVYSPASDCDEEIAQAPPGQAGKGFNTVCGVFVDDKRYNYKCKIEDYYEGNRKTHSVLYFPDQTLKLVWKPDGVVELHFEGMVPKTAKYGISEGETSFMFEDKRYFYTSDPNLASSRVEHFQQP